MSEQDRAIEEIADIMSTAALRLRSIAEVLPTPGLTPEQAALIPLLEEFLFALSGECPEENDPDHCEYCRAWFFWKALGSAFGKT
jgi:hypothetical protein